MTETGMLLSNPLHGERRPGTVGQPLPGIEARIVPQVGSSHTQPGIHCTVPSGCGWLFIYVMQMASDLGHRHAPGAGPVCWVMGICCSTT